MEDISTLLHARYGNTAQLSGGVNPTLATLLEHKSVREFLPETLPHGTLELIIAAAQSAATSSNLQTWSAVAIEESDLKSEAATLCGDQSFIRQAPLFLVFCADLSRLTNISQQHQKPGEGLEFTEMFLMASLDAALAAQNAVVGAESLGLGTCYVGAARNNTKELAALLDLPPRVIALFGLAVGRPNPAKPASVKPRLSQVEVLHRSKWNDSAQKKHLAAYDKTLADFNRQQHRENTPRWTSRSAHRIESIASLHGRHVLHQVLQERGFNLR